MFWISTKSREFRKKLINGDAAEDNASPFFYSDYINDYLEAALDFGITESQFWEMTLAELERAIESKKRLILAQQKEKAAYDYVLAQLIGLAFARVNSSKNKMPSLEDAYPTIFGDAKTAEERAIQEQERRKELSALRFIQFAQAHNKKFNEEVGNKEWMKD